MAGPPIVQLIPLQQIRSDISNGMAVSNYVMALMQDGTLALIHLPWEGNKFEVFCGEHGTFTVQMKPLTIDQAHWDF